MRVIAGTARRLNLETIPGEDTRPTTDRIKETLFNILQPELSGCRFLDCFAGSGGIGIEALSRGAREAVFIENSRRAAACIQKNLAHTHLEERGRLIGRDIFAALAELEREGKVFDIIFMDPPYGKEWERRVLERLEHSTIADGDTKVIVEANLQTQMDYAGELGFEVTRIKKYKTNQHIFLQRSGR